MPCVRFRAFGTITAQRRVAQALRPSRHCGNRNEKQNKQAENPPVLVLSRRDFGRGCQAKHWDRYLRGMTCSGEVHVSFVISVGCTPRPTPSMPKRRRGSSSESDAGDSDTEGDQREREEEEVDAPLTRADVSRTITGPWFRAVMALSSEVEIDEATQILFRVPGVLLWRARRAAMFYDSVVRELFAFAETLPYDLLDGDVPCCKSECTSMAQADPSSLPHCSCGMSDGARLELCGLATHRDALVWRAGQALIAHVPVLSLVGLCLGYALPRDWYAYNTSA